MCVCVYRCQLFIRDTKEGFECRLRTIYQYQYQLDTYQVCMYGHTYSKSMDQPGKVANPARGQLNRENEYSPVPARA